jgi:hypothetical protein
MKGKKTGGRRPGSPNTVSRAFKTALLEAFNDTRLGGVEGLVTWAATHRTEFYRLCALG